MQTSAGIDYGGPGITKMNKGQKACVWLGSICCTVGVLISMSSVVWRWILRIRGDRTVGSIASKVFWVGAVAFFCRYLCSQDR